MTALSACTDVPLRVICGVTVKFCVLLVSPVDITATVLGPAGDGGTTNEVLIAPVPLVSNPDTTVVPAKVIV
jgi:hypothetical protein